MEVTMLCRHSLARCMGVVIKQSPGAAFCIALRIVLPLDIRGIPNDFGDHRFALLQQRLRGFKRLETVGIQIASLLRRQCAQKIGGKASTFGRVARQQGRGLEHG
jgi:hypothetical protein